MLEKDTPILGQPASPPESAVRDPFAVSNINREVVVCPQKTI